VKPEEIKQKRVLFASLNWGMGHLSRSIALINRLIHQENILFFAGNEKQIEIISLYFPHVKCFSLNDYPFKFGNQGHFAFDLLRTVKPLYKRFKRESKDCNKLVNQLKIDIVISDHRYGFKSQLAKNIFITHQINLPLTKLQFPLQILHKRLMNRFDWIWIPDTIDSRYAGKLSMINNNTKYIHIGILSRFEIYGNQVNKTLDSTIIVSGPEELASDFLKSQIEAAIDKKMSRITIISSLINDYSKRQLIEIEYIKNWIDADKVILHSKSIISRSGYSTIMDIAYLQCESYLTPTPGQKEQEYLYQKWKEN
jgi:UDP-N-acetylglucosamine:LPS N-acetylglucosamine transferase